MKIPSPSRGLFFLFGCSLFFLPPPARADTDAVTPLASFAVGYVNGGCGFSFTPTTNLAVTRVGYLYEGFEGNTNPIIKFWAGTNYPMAGFPLVAGTIPDTMVYTNVSLTLLAGHRYSITLQEGPSLTNTVVLRAYNPGNVGFQVATQLTAYTGLVITSGVFTSFSPDVLYLGPNFSYQVLTTPIALPTLKMSRSNAGTAMVEWPAPSSGFLLMQTPSLATTNWTFMTNAVNVVATTNRVVVSPLTSNRFYRLFHP